MTHNENINIDDLPEELKGDIVPEIDPAKLFDEKEYATLIIGGEDSTKKDIQNADLISIIVSYKATREEKDEALVKLKTNKANTILLSAIKKTKSLSQKALIIAACWETGLDFSKDYLFFIDLICSTDFTVSFEAFTVITEMDAEIYNDTLLKSQGILKTHMDTNNNAKTAYEYISSKLTSN